MMSLDQTAINQLITDNIDTWTSTIKTKATTGRGSSKKLELYGVKKLRELILELAVRGKLVPQDPSDEPASVLLERVAEEKAQLITAKKIRRAKTAKSSDMPIVNFSKPTGWELPWIEELVVNSSDNIVDGPFGSKLKATEYVESGVPIIRIQNVDRNRFKNNGLQFLTPEKAVELERHSFVSGDIVLNKLGEPTGKACIIPEFLEQGIIVADIVRIRLDAVVVDKQFLTLAINSPFVANQFSGLAKGVTRQRVNLSQIRSLSLPLPPAKEQIKIVDRVNKLMILCDQLEQQTEASIEAHQVLVTTLLDTLTNSANAEELMQNWQMVAEHFDTLFTTEESIDQLKQTILQLAVMGKLVPQDPNDEPAAKLLERIAEHQLQRYKNKEIQKPKKITVDDNFDIVPPNGWRNVLLNDLVFVTKLAGFEYTKHINLEDTGEVAVIRAQNVRPFEPDLENLKYIDEKTSLALPRSSLDRPALLVTFIGAGIGDVCVFNKKERWHLAPNVAKVEPYADLNLHYLCIYLNSPQGKKELFKSMKSTAQPSLSMTTIREIWVALPPCAEQTRIVDSVESLLSICEQLKARLKESQMMQLHLTDAVVEQAL